MHGPSYIEKTTPVIGDMSFNQDTMQGLSYMFREEYKLILEMRMPPFNQVNIKVLPMVSELCERFLELTVHV